MDVIIDPILPNPFERMSLAFSKQENYGAAMKNIDAYLKGATLERKAFIQVFDTGAFSKSKYLSHMMKTGQDHTGEGNPVDENLHFSHVASSIYGIHPNGRMGVLDSPYVPFGQVNFAGEKILNKKGSGQFDWIAKGLKAGLEAAKPFLDLGHVVIWNNSWGAMGVNNDEIASIFEQARRSGIFIFAAAGNSGGQHDMFPASLSSTFSVAAVDQALKRASFSTISHNNNISGAGVNIWGADQTESGTQFISGTSMATPNVVGAIAAFLMCNKKVTPENLMGSLEAFCTDIDVPGLDPNTGYGVPDLIKFPKGATPVEPTPSDPVKRPKAAVVIPVINTWFDQVVFFSNQPASTFRCRIGLDFTAEQRTDIAVAKLLGALSTYFKNRGYVLPAGWDMYELAWTIGRFIEIIIPKDYYFKVNVKWVEVEYKGVTITREYTNPRPTKAKVSTLQDGITMSV